MTTVADAAVSPRRTRRPLASLYVRLSKEAKASNTSRDGMVADLRALADSHGFDVFAVHIDDGVSGAVRDRPEFLAWLADGRDGRVGALLAYHGDRITREGVNAAAMVLDVLEGKDSETGAVVRQPIRFLSCDGLDSRDADGFRWRFVIAAEVARGERERIKVRNIDSQRRLREAGRFPGGAIPYGTRVLVRYDDGREVRHEDPKRLPPGPRYLETHPFEAECLREAASRLIRGD